MLRIESHDQATVVVVGPYHIKPIAVAQLRALHPLVRANALCYIEEVYEPTRISEAVAVFLTNARVSG